MVRNAPKPMRNAAIPALTRGWLSAPARIRLVDAARTRPPAVSAVIRMRASLVGGRASFRGIRLGASARPRILADGGVAGLFFSGQLPSRSPGRGRRGWWAGVFSGHRDPGPDRAGTARLGGGGASRVLALAARSGL